MTVLLIKSVPGVILDIVTFETWENFILEVRSQMNMNRSVSVTTTFIMTDSDLGPGRWGDQHFTNEHTSTGVSGIFSGLFTHLYSSQHLYFCPGATFSMSPLILEWKVMTLS